MVHKKLPSDIPATGHTRGVFWRTPVFWLAVIVVIGLFVRLWRFADFMEIDGDHARDILIAKHLIEFGEGFWTAPYAFGAKGAIANSPVFYWILAFMWFISRSALGMGIVFAMASVVAIVMAYSAGLFFVGGRVGLVFAFFVSISSLFARDARGICQTCFMPDFAIISLFFMALFLRLRSTVSLILFVTSLFVGVHIHQSFLPFLSIGLIWAAWRYIHDFRSGQMFFTCVVLNVLMWALVTGNTITVLGRYLDLVIQGSGISFSHFLARVWQTVYILILRVPGSVAYGYLGFVCVSLFLLWRKRIHTERTMDVFMLFGGLLLYGLYRHNGEIQLPPHYLRVGSVVFLFILSYCVVSLLRNTRVLAGFVCVTGILLGIGNMRYFGSPGGNYGDHYQVTMRAYNDMTSMAQDSADMPIAFYANYLSDPADSWRYAGNAAPQWYFLEELLHKKIVTLPKGANSFSPPSVGQDTVIYLVCVNDLGKTFESEPVFREKCVAPFLSHYSYAVGNRYEVQLPALNGRNGHTYRIYRYAP